MSETDLHAQKEKAADRHNIPFHVHQPAVNEIVVNGHPIQSVLGTFTASFPIDCACKTVDSSNLRASRAANSSNVFGEPIHSEKKNSQLSQLIAPPGKWETHGGPRLGPVKLAYYRQGQNDISLFWQFVPKLTF